MKNTGTVILWPSRLKIGAKSKKGEEGKRERGESYIFKNYRLSKLFLSDPQVKVAGPPDGVSKAKDAILEELDTKNNRVTLKINIANSEHSHVIGKEGCNIRKGKNMLHICCSVFSSSSSSSHSSFFFPSLHV